MSPVYRIRKYRAPRPVALILTISAAAILVWLFVCCWLAMGAPAQDQKPIPQRDYTAGTLAKEGRRG